MAANGTRKTAQRMVAVLRKEYGRCHITTKRSPVEELLLGIIVPGTSERKAVAALNAMAQQFVDWNEVRVTTASELAEALPDVPDALRKAEIIRSALNHMHEVTVEKPRDFLRESSIRERMKMAASIPDFPEVALARATMIGLGEPHFPLTPNVVRICSRIGLLDHCDNHQAMVKRFGKSISVQGMLEFHWLASRHAEAVCDKDHPACETCGLAEHCRHGKQVVKEAKAKAKSKPAPPAADPTKASDTGGAEKAKPKPKPAAKAKAKAKTAPRSPRKSAPKPKAKTKAEAKAKTKTKGAKSRRIAKPTPKRKAAASRRGTSPGKTAKSARKVKATQKRKRSRK